MNATVKCFTERIRKYLKYSSGSALLLINYTALNRNGLISAFHGPCNYGCRPEDTAVNELLFTLIFKSLHALSFSCANIL